MVGECSTNFSSFQDFGKPIPYLKRANWKLVLYKHILYSALARTCNVRRKLCRFLSSCNQVPILRVMIAKRGVYSSYLKVYEAVVWHLSEISGAVAVKSFESAGS